MRWNSLARIVGAFGHIPSQRGGSLAHILRRARDAVSYAGSFPGCSGCTLMWWNFPECSGYTLMRWNSLTRIVGAFGPIPSQIGRCPPHIFSRMPRAFNTGIKRCQKTGINHVTQMLLFFFFWQPPSQWITRELTKKEIPFYEMPGIINVGEVAVVYSVLKAEFAHIPRTARDMVWVTEIYCGACDITSCAEIRLHEL